MNRLALWAGVYNGFSSGDNYLPLLLTIQRYICRWYIFNEERLSSTTQLIWLIVWVSSTKLAWDPFTLWAYQNISRLWVGYCSSIVSVYFAVPKRSEESRL